MIKKAILIFSAICAMVVPVWADETTETETVEPTEVVEVIDTETENGTDGDIEEGNTDTGEESVSEPTSETTTETIVVSEDRPIMLTALADYSVTEGLLLAIFVLLVLYGVIWVMKGAFALWLI